MKKVVATIACRNNSKRLYGKPLQNLGNNLSVLDFIIMQLQQTTEIDEIVLAISEMPGNETFQHYCKEKGLKYVTGDDRDVLDRLIKGCKLANGDIVFRMTSESPFPYLELLPEAKQRHLEKNADYTIIAQLPDGGTFELINLEALEESHRSGDSTHRSELCTLYINQNKDKFKFNVMEPPQKHRDPELRLTIDYPEDLIFCRKIFAALDPSGNIPYDDLLAWVSQHPEERKILDALTDDNYVKPYY